MKALSPNLSLWVLFAAAGLVALLWRQHLRSALRRTVFANLDSAFENGYFARGEHLHGASPDEIAYDMTLHCAEVEDVKPWALTPHVHAWMVERRLL